VALRRLYIHEESTGSRGYRQLEQGSREVYGRMVSHRVVGIRNRVRKSDLVQPPVQSNPFWAKSLPLLHYVYIEALEPHSIDRVLIL
jgi:hypothetical protein